MFIQSKPVVIDGKGHLTGRLAAIVAKTLLNGQRVVVVRCEELLIGGCLYVNKSWFFIMFIYNLLIHSVISELPCFLEKAHQL